VNFLTDGSEVGRFCFPGEVLTHHHVDSRDVCAQLVETPPIFSLILDLATRLIF
jgi:hypothetical protein